MYIRIAKIQLNALLPDCMCADFAIVSDKPEAALLSARCAAASVDGGASHRGTAQFAAAQFGTAQFGAVQIEEEEAKVHFETTSPLKVATK